MESDAHELRMFFRQFIDKPLGQGLSRQKRAAGAAQVFHREIVEVDYRIGLGPQADLSRIFEGVVPGRDLQLAIVITAKFVAARLRPDLVPDAGRDLEIRPGKLNTPAVD